MYATYFSKLRHLVHTFFGHDFWARHKHQQYAAIHHDMALQLDHFPLTPQFSTGRYSIWQISA